MDHPWHPPHGGLHAVIVGAFDGDVGGRSDWSIVAANLAILPIALGTAAGVVRPRGLDVRPGSASLGRWLVRGFRCSPVRTVSPRLLGGWWGCGLRSALWRGRSGGWAGAPPTGSSTAAAGPERGDRPHAAELGERPSAESVPMIVLKAAVDAVYLDGGRISGPWFGP
jgi:hypothetical protein